MQSQCYYGMLCYYTPLNSKNKILESINLDSRGMKCLLKNVLLPEILFFTLSTGTHYNYFFLPVVIFV